MRLHCVTSLRQSDLASFARCAQQVHLDQLLAQGGERGRTLSATVFGTVMHHAVQVMEELHQAGEPNACERAVRTFEHYWHPDNIGELEPYGVDVWLPRQTQGGLLIRGRDNLRNYYRTLTSDTGRLLALELNFHVPWKDPITGDWHDLNGTVDRLALRKDSTRKKPYLSVEDFKTGTKPTYLRHALQWTVYSYASLQPEFWTAWPEEDLQLLKDTLRTKGLALYRDGSELPVIPRRGRWIALRDTFGIHDAGWRTLADFQRMDFALRQYIRAVEADVFPLSISGQVCTYCPHLYSGLCGGRAFDKNDEGQPYPGV